VQDLVLMVGFGVIGYIFRRLDIPTAPVILAMVLGDLMEQALRQSLIISDGSLGIFFTRPISLVLLILAAISITNPYWKHIGGYFKKIFAPQAA
jgi:putative tricarboxylic transport membrane protein